MDLRSRIEARREGRTPDGESGSLCDVWPSHLDGVVELDAARLCSGDSITLRFRAVPSAERKNG